MEHNHQTTCENCNRQLPPGAENCPACGAAVPVPLPQKPETPRDRYLGRLILDRYRIVERIARGGMGEVYKAEHIERDLEQHVAVKFLHRRFANEPSFSARFFNEARYSARIRHPNAVRVFDRGSLEDGTLFIVMEYVRGESLSRYIKRVGMIDIAPAIRIATQIASVLAEAHQSGVIHRDVKPDNIMLMKSARPGFPHVTVLDFGIAKMFDDDHGHQTDTNVIFGTPEYMSPEQGRGHPYDHRVDIYALGLLIYYMLVGKPPFTGKDKVAVVHQQCYEPVPALHTQTSQPVPARLSELVARMVAKDPDERPADMLEVMRELEGLAVRDDGVAFEEALRQSAQRDDDTPSTAQSSGRSAKGRTVGSIAEPAREAIEEVRRQIARERGADALAHVEDVDRASPEAPMGNETGGTARNRAGLAASTEAPTAQTPPGQPKRPAREAEFVVRAQESGREVITGVIPAERDIWQLSMRSASAALPAHQVRVGVSSGIRVGRREQLALVALALVLSVGILFALGRTFVAAGSDGGGGDAQRSPAIATSEDRAEEAGSEAQAQDTPAEEAESAEEPRVDARDQRAGEATDSEPSSAAVAAPPQGESSTPNRGAAPQGLPPRNEAPSEESDESERAGAEASSAQEAGDDRAAADIDTRGAGSRAELDARVGRAALTLSSGDIDEARRLVRELAAEEPAPEGTEWASLRASMRRAEQLVSQISGALDRGDCRAAEAAASSISREVSAHLATLQQRRIRDACSESNEQAQPAASAGDEPPSAASQGGDAPMRLPSDREEPQREETRAEPRETPQALPPAEL